MLFELHIKMVADYCLPVNNEIPDALKSQSVSRVYETCIIRFNALLLVIMLSLSASVTADMTGVMQCTSNDSQQQAERKFLVLLPGQINTTRYDSGDGEALFNLIVEQQFSIYTDDGLQIYFCRQPLWNRHSFLGFSSSSTH